MFCIHCFQEADRSNEPTGIDEFVVAEKRVPTNNTESGSMNERRLTTTSNETPFTVVDNYVEGNGNEVFNKDDSIVNSYLRLTTV